MKSLEVRTAEFRVFVSYYYSHPNSSNCDEVHTSPKSIVLHAKGSNLTAESDSGYASGRVFEREFLYFSVYCYCEITFWLTLRFHRFEIERPLDLQKEKHNPFTEFQKKHAEKFAFLGGERNRRPIGGYGSTLTPEEQELWKKLYYEKKAKQEKKLKLFQKMGDLKTGTFTHIEGLEMRPFLQEILVVVG